LGFYFVSFAITEDTTGIGKVGLSVFFPTAMGLGATTFANIESAGGHINRLIILASSTFPLSANLYLYDVDVLPTIDDLQVLIGPH
jgi:hypothetical protein